MNSYPTANIWILIIVNSMNSYTHSIIWIHILRQWYEFIFSLIVLIHTPTPSYELESCVWIHIFKSIPTTPTITHMELSIGHSPSVTVHYDNLPYGCGNKFDSRGRALYIDHNTKCTTLERPLPPIEDHCKHNDPSDNRIVASVNNLLCLTSDLNSWTSNLWLLTVINL